MQEKIAGKSLLQFFIASSALNLLYSLKSQEGIESSRQRWFYGGKLLGDKLHVEEAKIPTGYVVQVIVNMESTPVLKQAL